MMMDQRKEKISITISPRVLRLIEEACDNENRKRSNFIETVLKKYFQEERFIEGEATLSRPMARTH